MGSKWRKRRNEGNLESFSSPLLLHSIFFKTQETGYFGFFYEVVIDRFLGISCQCLNFEVLD